MPADSAAGDSAVYQGQWNTLVFNVVDYVLGGTLDPFAVGTMGIQVQEPETDTPDWSGSLYFDNYTLYGVVQPEGNVASPLVEVIVDTLENAGGMVWNQARIGWVDNSLGTETYNVYRSAAAITDVTADGVIRIATGIPHGTEYWNDRPFTTAGDDVTFYYAVVAVVDQQETALNEQCTAGPIDLVSSETAKVRYVQDFSSSFVLDGLDTEFQPYSEYRLLPEGATGAASTGWTPASTDMNFAVTFIIDDTYLYISADVTDDDLREAPYQAWEGDALEFFLGIYDARDLTVRHGNGSVDAGNGDWRISFITDGSTQQSGSNDFNFPGMESTAYQKFTGDGYII